MSKPPRVQIARPEWEPPPGLERQAMQQLKQRLDATLIEKTQLMVCLMAVIHHLGGELTFPSAELQAVSPQDKLHYRIEDENTTLTYEAVGDAASFPASPPPPKSRIILPGQA